MQENPMLYLKPDDDDGVLLMCRECRFEGDDGCTYDAAVTWYRSPGATCTSYAAHVPTVETIDALYRATYDHTWRVHNQPFLSQG